MNDQLIDSFTRFAEEARQKYGIVCQLADIRGARWSYVTGSCPAEMPSSEPMSVTLAPGLGVVIYDIKGLSREELDKVKTEILTFWGRLPVA